MTTVFQDRDLTVDYRYYVVDLLSNQLLAEIPFTDVSYSRSLREAGTFSGSIAVTEATTNLNLYETTMPGKTALYITRNNVCVWGGIIWTRSYDIVEKRLDISGSEFTSYLYKRVIWKTWDNDYQASINVSESSGIAEVTLDFGQFPFTAGKPVFIDWGRDYSAYNGYYTVLASPAPGFTEDERSVFSVTATYVNEKGQTKNIPELVVSAEEGTIYSGATVEVRQDTYDYARDLLTELKTDLYDFDFANDAIKPGIDIFTEIESYSRSANFATIVTRDPHKLVVGQKISITDLGSGFDNFEALVTSIEDDRTFKYANSGSNVSSTDAAERVVNISQFQRDSNITTITTASAHGFEVGDIVFISELNASVDGYYNIYTVNTPNTSTFQIVNPGNAIGLSSASTTRSATITTIQNSTPTAGFVTYTTTAAHGFTVGDYVNITDVTSSYAGLSQIVGVNSTATFTVANSSTVTPSDQAGTASIVASATVSPAVTYTTWGEYTENGDIRVDYSTTLPSQNQRKNQIIRGYELKTVGEVLEEYSNVPDGFEYRIDCSFDQVTNSFKRTFVFLPLLPASLKEYLDSLPGGVLPPGEFAPVSAYGADEYVFEYPGNVLNAALEENAQDSATRFWVQGDDSSLSSDASQPYAAATDYDLLLRGWPLLEEVEKADDVSEENTLYSYAKRYLAESRPPISNFTISVNGSFNPVVGSYKPGDWCSVIINDDFVSLRLTSYIEVNDGIGREVLLRKIDAYEVSVPDNPSFPEQVTLQLVTEAEVDKIGD